MFNINNLQSILQGGLLCLLLAGCGANSSDRSRSDRVMALLNQREYGQAITLLEDQYRSDQSNRALALQLAQAHLGAAQVEILDFATDVLAAQAPSTELDLFYTPRCDTQAITSISGYDFRCLGMRILQRLPEADNPHVLRAQSLLRTAFPNPRTTPLDVNFLATFVEVGSAFSRLRVLFDRTLVESVELDASTNPSSLPFGLVIHHLKRFITEICNGFIRAKFSYSKVSGFVVTYEGMPLIRVGDQELVFSENFSIESLLQFTRRALMESRGSVNRELSTLIEDNIMRFGSSFLRILERMDVINFNGEGRRRLNIYWQFSNAVDALLGGLAGNLNSDNHDYFRLFWEHPPEILKDLASAAQEAWDTESSAPLVGYFANTKVEWDQANDLVRRWDIYLNYYLTTVEKETLLQSITAYAAEYQRTHPIPVHLSATIVKEKLRELQRELLSHANLVITNQIKLPIYLHPHTSAIGLSLLSDTESWVLRNTWPEL